MRLGVNSVWRDWKVVRLIGQGSFGDVYEIHRELFGITEKAALKVITIPKENSEIEELYSDGYDNESVTQHFRDCKDNILKEYAMMAKLKGNPNVVHCEDLETFQHSDGIGWDIYIRMELMTPLTKVLDERRLTEEEIVNVGCNICSALIKCETQSIIHRDIKPQNILVSETGVCKLGDFGVAKIVESATGGKTKVGTYKYMAPEIYNNQPYGNTVDIYSLGLVLYWLLNERRTPFLPLPPERTTVLQDSEARAHRFAGDTLPDPAHGCPELKKIVLKACAFDPKDRYASAKQMYRDLETLKNRASEETVYIFSASPNDKGKEKPVKTQADSAIDRTDIWVNAQSLQESNSTGSTIHKFTQNKAEASEPNNNAQERQASSQQGPVCSNTQAPMQNYATNIPSQGQKGETERKKRRGIAVWIAVATVLVAVFGGIVLLMRGKNNDTNTNWVDELPDYVTEENYTIEERTLYSSRKLETTSSTTSNKMAGWELYDTAEGNGEFGAWSDWSQTIATKSDSRDVQNETRYRYRDKETTTSTSPNLSGWTLDNVTTSWGDWGSWSSWSTDSVSQDNDGVQIETKTQYRYRDISYTTQYTSWGSWSGWQDSYVTPNDLTDVETRTAYHYYYYVCSNCGAHMHGYGTCYKWAGGCGSNSVIRDSYNAVRCTVPYSNAYDFHGTGTYYTDNTGEGRGFAYIYSSSPYYVAPITQYRYRTRSTYQEINNYGSWSSWGDTYYSNSSSRDGEMRTVYRYRTRNPISTYYYYRWKDWSAWSTTAVSQSNTKEVETATFYRYRDRVTKPTYYFQRWTEWSEYFESPVEESDTVEVRTKTQYRYHSK